MIKSNNSPDILYSQNPLCSLQKIIRGCSHWGKSLFLHGIIIHICCFFLCLYKARRGHSLLWSQWQFSVRCDMRRDANLSLWKLSFWLNWGLLRNGCDRSDKVLLAGTQQISLGQPNMKSSIFSHFILAFQGPSGADTQQVINSKSQRRQPAEAAN